MTRAIKRLADILLAALALIILSPVMLAVAAWALARQGWPVLFAQERPGLGGVPFTLYKFRSMDNRTDAEGRLLPPAQRLTLLGRLLRKTSLDEVPELYNVLRGDMSLVGPRPLRMEYLHRYSPTQRRRHEVKPGLTGLAQVRGRNLLGWEERLALDVWYVDNWSLWLDLSIILRTPWVVLAGAGVSPEGEAVMPEFMGNEDRQH